MDSFIPIAPFAVTKQATKVQISMPSFHLNETEADVYVTLYTDAGGFVDSKLVHVPPDIHAKWGTDDNYIVDYVMTQLKVTRAAPSPEAPPGLVGSDPH